MFSIGLVASSPDNVSVKIFERPESSLADKAAPVIRSNLEVFDKAVLVFRHKSAMLAGNFSSGNVIWRRCLSTLLFFSVVICKILEEIVST